MALGAVSVRVEQAGLPGLPEDASPEQVAGSLLAALRAAFTVRWEVKTAGGSLVSLSVDLGGDRCEWPPREVRLCVADPAAGDGLDDSAVEIQVPSGALSGETLGLILGAGLDLQGPPQEKAPPQGAPICAAPGEELVDSDAHRGIAQPRCLPQWHPGACGHCALFNVRCLLQRFCGLCEGTLARVPAGLHDEPALWRGALADVRALSVLGRRSGRWPSSRVLGGVLDELHVAELVNSDGFLSRHVSVVPSPDVLSPDAPGAPALAAAAVAAGAAAQRALAAVAAGAEPAHGFLLACSIHWIGLVVVSEGPHRIWLCDSFNRPLANLRHPEQVPKLAERHDGEARAEALASLRALAGWRHRPEQHLEQALKEGVTEWWKGSVRSSMFWRHQPEEVRRALRESELAALQRYLELFTAAMRREL